MPVFVGVEEEVGKRWKPLLPNGENLLPGSNSLSSICECGKFRANSWQPRWAEFLRSPTSIWNIWGATMNSRELYWTEEIGLEFRTQFKRHSRGWLVGSKRCHFTVVCGMHQRPGIENHWVLKKKTELESWRQRRMNDSVYHQRWNSTNSLFSQFHSLHHRFAAVDCTTSDYFDKLLPKQPNLLELHRKQPFWFFPHHFPWRKTQLSSASALRDSAASAEKSKDRGTFWKQPNICNLGQN